MFKGVLTQNQYQIKKFRGANSMKQIYSIQKLSLIFKVYIAMLFIVFSEFEYTELEYLSFGNVYFILLDVLLQFFLNINSKKISNI